MKKILTMVVAAMMATGASAQFEPGTWSLQPQIGVGLSDITGMENMDFFTEKIDRTLTGSALLGVEVEYQTTKKLSFSAGARYALQGCGWEDFKFGTTKVENSKIMLEYVNIPVTANYYIGKGFAVKIGVQFGFLTAANMNFKFEDKMGGRDVTQNTKMDIKDEFKTFDLSIPVGVSYESSDNWVLDLRYNAGATKINKEGDDDYRNGVLVFTIGKKFSL